MKENEKCLKKKKENRTVLSTIFLKESQVRWNEFGFIQKIKPKLMPKKRMQITAESEYLIMCDSDRDMDFLNEWEFIKQKQKQQKIQTIFGSAIKINQ